ncbi:hypothetical protein [Thiolapillus sp.]
MSDALKEDAPGEVEEPAGWGKKLFLVTLVAVLGFFYWLLVYSGGVSVHHG